MKRMTVAPSLSSTRKRVFSPGPRSNPSSGSRNIPSAATSFDSTSTCDPLTPSTVTGTGSLTVNPSNLREMGDEVGGRGADRPPPSRRPVRRPRPTPTGRRSHGPDRPMVARGHAALRTKRSRLVIASDNAPSRGRDRTGPDSARCERRRAACERSDGAGSSSVVHATLLDERRQSADRRERDSSIPSRGATRHTVRRSARPLYSGRCPPSRTRTIATVGSGVMAEAMIAGLLARRARRARAGRREPSAAGAPRGPRARVRHPDRRRQRRGGPRTRTSSCSASSPRC